MKRHFFVKKSNTIFEGSRANTGMNPILELHYGDGISRVLLKVNTEEIKEKYINVYGRSEKQTYVLKMKNCSSLVKNDFSDELSGPFCKDKERASSFDLILFRLPREFDQGTGSSSCKDLWYDNKISYSKNGCNWFQAKNLDEWKPDDETNMGIEGADYGIYSIDYLSGQLNKFNKGEDSIIIAKQHFEFGYENLSMDITKEINNILDGKIKNYGFGLSFVPELEIKEEEKLQYAGFFSDRTNTVFHPYVEIDDNIEITDDRILFNPAKENRLMFISKPFNFDEMPICTIDGVEYNVEMVRNGVYCAVIPPLSINTGECSLHYDKWSNLSINGIKLTDVEMSFEERAIDFGLSIGNGRQDDGNFIPSVYGINNNESIDLDQAIKVSVKFIKEYDGNKRKIFDRAEYKLYSKENNDTITILDYSAIDLIDDQYSFMLFTGDLVPDKYYIDIRVTDGAETKVFKDVCHFNIIGDTTNRFI